MSRAVMQQSLWLLGDKAGAIANPAIESLKVSIQKSTAKPLENAELDAKGVNLRTQFEEKPREPYFEEEPDGMVHEVEPTERAGLVAEMQRHNDYMAGFNEGYKRAQQAAVPVKSFSAIHPENLSATCKCEHWQSCSDCHPTAHLSPQPPQGYAL